MAFVDSFETPEQRFERYTTKGPGCWLWTGHPDHFGYGTIRVGKRRVKAHRYSYEKHHGPFDQKLFVCHKCDVPNCVNPDHLFLGTNADNVKDMMQKGRKISASKLKKENILCIKTLYAYGVFTQNQIAEMFGVSRTNISLIVNGHRWQNRKEG